MSILVPLNDATQLARFAEAGAKQFYIGFYDNEWMWEFGANADLNRMSGFGEGANAYSFEEALGIVSEARELGVRIYATLNAAIYTPAQVMFQERYFAELAAAGATGVIVSTPQQVEAACKYDLDVVVSTMGGVYNSLAARWWGDLGARRIILPRDLTLDEIEQIATDCPDLEFEVFLMRNGCIFSDAHCLGMHGGERGGTCHEVKNAWMVSNGPACPSAESLAYNAELYCDSFHVYACGLCALYRLANLGIAAFKVVGRCDEADSLCFDIALAAQNLEIARSCSSEQEYRERMVRHPYEQDVCVVGLNCYYPEARFGAEGFAE